MDLPNSTDWLPSSAEKIEYDTSMTKYHAPPGPRFLRWHSMNGAIIRLAISGLSHRRTSGVRPPAPHLAPHSGSTPLPRTPSPTPYTPSHLQTYLTCS